VGCILFMTPTDIAQTGGSLVGSGRSGLETFQTAMEGLGPDGRARLHQALEHSEVDRRQLGSLVSNVHTVVSPERVDRVCRDLDILRREKPSALGKVFTESDSGSKQTIAARLNKNPRSEVNGAAYELRVAAGLCEGESKLLDAGLHLGPTDTLSLGRKLKANIGAVTLAPGEPEAHLSYGAKRNTVEADLLIERDKGLGHTERIGVDTKFRSNDKVRFWGKERKPTDGEGFDDGGFGDQLYAISKVIEQGRLDGFVLVTTTTCHDSVHEFVAGANAHLVGCGKQANAIKIVEHFDAG